MFPIQIISRKKREFIINEIQKLSSIEQTALIIDSLKLLSFNLVKFVTCCCNEILEQQKNGGSANLLTNSVSNKVSGENYEFFNILEEQANDSSNFFSV